MHCGHLGSFQETPGRDHSTHCGVMRTDGDPDADALQEWGGASRTAGHGQKDRNHGSVLREQARLSCSKGLLWAHDCALSPPWAICLVQVSVRDLGRQNSPLSWWLNLKV